MERHHITSADVIDATNADNDVIGIVGEVSSLIACDVVEAVCQSIEYAHYRPFHETRLVFTFRIVEPAALNDQRVQMFCRIDKSWKFVPESAAVFKAACVALGRRLHRGEKITKNIFLRHLYRCRLRTSGKGPAAYTVVDRLLERLA